MKKKFFNKKKQKSVMRLNKYVAHSGICSRRKAAELVKAGEIKVNGKVESNPAYEVQDHDTISYQNKKLKIGKKKIYILLNKPKNTLTTVTDDRGRPTVIDLVKRHTEERIYPVGRLDRNTLGLLLLTNDGDLAKKLSHPSSETKKVYHVVLDKEVSKKDIETILKGLELEDGKTDVDKLYHQVGKEPTEVAIELHSGKNRIIRRIFEHMGYHVVKLDRVYFAGLTKKDLPRGWSRHLSKKEVIMLKHFS